MDNFPIVQKSAVAQYEKAAKGGIKLYPSLELVRLINRFFKSRKGKLLEYGFGSGCNTIHLLKSGYNVFGLDVSKNCTKRTSLRINKIKDLKRKPRLIHLKPESKQIPFPSNHFDFIVAMSVLSLLGSRSKVKNLLKEFKRILKPKGKIILDINDQNSVFSGKKNKIKSNVYKAKPVDGFINTFCLKSEKDFKNLVKPHFSIVDIGFSSHKLFRRTITEFIICATK
jgi:ubiquinone/menaquinone biosynthesis C-methylase UbiE